MSSARLLLQLLAFLLRPRPLSRGAKKKAGLKYCRYAGYGYRWHRGKRIEDDAELQTMQTIAELRKDGLSWQRIAVHLLRNRVRTRVGREWSASRVRRAFLAGMQRGMAGRGDGEGSLQPLANRPAYSREKN